MTPAGRSANGPGFRGKIAGLGFVLGLGAALAAVSAALGTRLGWWSYRDAFAVLPWTVYGGIAAASLSLAGAAANRRFSARLALLALLGLALGIGVAWIPYQAREALRASPRLSDITTDTANPPAFVAALEQRNQSRATNTTAYTPEKAALQATSYPDIRPVILPLPPEQAFARALAAIDGMGLVLIAADRTAGRIEAYERSFWFGFIDDVAVRIVAAPGGSRVDIRSSSRVGLRDAAMNARRVRRLAAALTEKQGAPL